MSRQSHIHALLERADLQLDAIEKEYESSLHAKKITESLSVDIKNFCENLRSVLDYLAHDIRDKYFASGNASKRFYFPICSNYTEFSKCVNKWFPGLKSVAPSVWAELEKSQPYQAGNDWLDDFIIINNKNKHNALVPQNRQLTGTRVNVKLANEQSVSWDPKNVHIGRGVNIGGVPINPETQRPDPSPHLSVVETEWYDFFFDGIGVSALGLLRKSANGIKAINNALVPYL